MSFTHPHSGNGYIGPNGGQFYTYIPSPLYGTHPDVIGEGEVASILLPDGTIQFYFIPTTNKLPHMYNPLIHNNVTFRNNAGVWFVKNISNAIPPAVFQQYCQGPNGEPFFKSYFNLDCNINSTPAFQLKFHNDNWTSTTDLHYFYPCLRQSTWFPAVRNTEYEAIAVQVEIPIDTKPISEHVVCHCSYDYVKNNGRTLKKENSSHMSIVQSESRDSVSKKNKGRKKREVTCKCDKLSSIDKSVTTYIDQGSSCNSPKGCETQTYKCDATTAVQNVNSTNSTKHRNARPEIWIPKTPKSQKAMKTNPSERVLEINESGCSSSCTCNSDNE